ncbi:MAG: hypothetical protein U0892_02440 [Pirellulales bacterium]
MNHSHTDPRGPLARRQRHQRRAGVLIPVLVLITIIAMLCGQSYRTIMFSVRAERERAAMRQLRELIELGRLRMEQQVAADPNYSGEKMKVSVAKPIADGDSAEQWASIEIQWKPMAAVDDSNVSAEKSDAVGNGRVVVRYPVGEPNEQSAEWENHE